MSRSSIVLVVALLAGTGLAGCLDEDEAPAAAPQTSESPATNVTVDDGTGEMPVDVGHQPHMHDYWDGRERVTLLETDLEPDAFEAFVFTFVNVVGLRTPGAGGAFVELPEGAIVYEGTGKLEFTASWSDPTVTGMTMRYQSAASPEFSEALPVSNGQPVVVDVTPQMSDMPHEKTSRWSFLLMAGAGQSMVGKIHVKVDIVKMRDISTFPGHPELFGGANTLTLYDGPAKSTQMGIAGRLVDVAVNGFRFGQEGVRSQKVVPMETLSMTANVTVTSATAGVGKVTGVTFLYKPADSGRFFRAQVLSSSPDTGVYQFAWPVEMSQTDSPYAEESQWAFNLRVQTDPTGVGNGQCGGCSDAEVEYTLAVVAYDALLEGVEPASHDEDRDD